MTSNGAPAAGRLVIHIAIQFLIRSSGLVSGVLGAALLARGMSVPDFARLTLCLSALGLVTTLTELGLTSTAVKELASGDRNDRDVTAGLFWARACTAGVGFLLALLITAKSFGFATYWLPGFLVLGSLLLSPATTGSASAMAQLQVGRQNLVLFVQAWLWPVAIVVVVAANGGGGAFALAFLIAAAANAAIAFVSYPRPAARTRGALGAAWKIIRTALPYGTAALLISCYFRIGGILLYRLAGPSDSATFAAAFRILDPLQAIPATALAVVLPMLSRAYAGHDPQQINKRRVLYHLAYRFSLLVGLPTAVGISLLAGPITRLLYGANYPQAAHVLSVLIWAFPPICIGYTVISACVASGRSRSLSVVCATVLVANLTACLTLLSHGAVAAAWITVGTEWVVAGLVTSLLATGTNLRPPFDGTAKIVGAALVLSVSVLLTRHLPIAVPIGLGVLVYAGACIGLGAIHKTDLALVVPRAGRTVTK